MKGGRWGVSLLSRLSSSYRLIFVLHSQPAHDMRGCDEFEKRGVGAAKFLIRPESLIAFAAIICNDEGLRYATSMH